MNTFTASDFVYDLNACMAFEEKTGLSVFEFAASAATTGDDADATQRGMALMKQLKPLTVFLWAGLMAKQSMTVEQVGAMSLGALLKAIPQALIAFAQSASVDTDNPTQASEAANA